MNKPKLDINYMKIAPSSIIALISFLLLAIFSNIIVAQNSLSNDSIKIYDLCESVRSNGANYKSSEL